MPNLRGAVISGPVTRPRWSGEAEADETSGEPTNSRVCPIAPVSTWRCDADGGQRITPTSELSETGEHHFWDTPPRYSVTNLQSIAPAPVGPAPSLLRIGSARLLFATIFCATVVLLALELKALTTQAAAPQIADGNDPGAAATVESPAVRP